MKVVTHLFPHLDEIFAWWLLWYFGERKFPKIKSAKLVQMERNYPPEDENTILIGVGYGRFDEHAMNGGEPKALSCATLVAQHLGIYGRPELQQLIQAVERHDSQGGNGLFDLPSLMASMRQDGDSEEEVIETAFYFFFKLFRQQRKFHKNAAQFREKVRIRVLPCGIRMATLIGQIDMAPSIARSRYGAESDLFLQKNDNGVQIFINRGNDIARKGIARLVAKLRFEEQKITGRVKISDWQRLSANGLLEEVPEWYFHGEAYQVFNGSLTKSVPPTRLEFRDIVRLAAEAMAEAAERA